MEKDLVKVNVNELVRDYLNSFGKEHKFNFLKEETILRDKDFYNSINIESKRVIFEKIDYRGYKNRTQYSPKNDTGNIGIDPSYFKLHSNEKEDMKVVFPENIEFEEDGTKYESKDLVVVRGSWTTQSPYKRMRAFYLDRLGVVYYQEISLRKKRGKESYYFKITGELIGVIGGDFIYRENDGTWSIKDKNEIEAQGNNFDFKKVDDCIKGIDYTDDETTHENLNSYLSEIHYIDRRKDWLSIGKSKCLEGTIVLNGRNARGVFDSNWMMNTKLVRRNGVYGFRVFKQKKLHNADYFMVHLSEKYRMVLSDTRLNVYELKNGHINRIENENKIAKIMQRLKPNEIQDFIKDNFKEGLTDLEDLSISDYFSTESSRLYTDTYLKYHKNDFLNKIDTGRSDCDPIFYNLGKFHELGNVEWFLYHENKYTISRYFKSDTGLKSFIKKRYSFINESAKNYYELIGLNEYQFNRIKDQEVSRSSSNKNELYSIRRLLLNGETGDIKHIDNDSFDKAFNYMFDLVRNLRLTQDHAPYYTWDFNDKFIDLNVSINTIFKNKDLISDIVTRSGDFVRDNGAWMTYRDYLTMLNDVPENIRLAYKVFPENYADLMLLHDNLTAVYNQIISELEEEKYEEISSSYDKYLYKDDKYIITKPSRLSDVVDEGVALHHCVSSYVKRIVVGETNILFIRDIENQDKSLYTVEVNPKNEIIQVKGLMNTRPSDEAKNFIKQWSTEKGLKVVSY